MNRTKKRESKILAKKELRQAEAAMKATRRKKQTNGKLMRHPIMAANMTSFADMIRSSPPALKERLKLPPWLKFLLPYKRKDQASLSETERERFLCAINTLIQNGTYGQLVSIHADMSHMMHGTQRFLPWHRVYLLQLEQAIQSIHPDVTIPYWDWTQAGEQGIPQWLQGVTPTVPMPQPTPPITVIRQPGTQQDVATLASNIPAIMQLTDFVDFWSHLEGVHNGVHVWVGGSMGSIPTAPADPIFWMHHANIDRIWWNWQSSPQGQGKNPNLSGSAAVMDPFAYTEPQTRDITALGYIYV